MSVTTRLHMPLPATYQSPAQVQLYGDDAPLVPMPMYLVEHPEGLVLFDVGLDPTYSGDPVAGYGEVAERIRIDFDDRHLIEPYLERRGHTLNDVTTVIASHLHWDHIGGLKQFANARIILGRGEPEYAADPERFAQPFYREADFSEEHGLKYDLIDDDLDVFGDGSVKALWLPGHTPGSLALQVSLGDDTFILSGDTVHTWDGYENEIHYHGDVDSITARASLRRLKEIVRAERALLWIAHDPGGWETYGSGEIKR